jgi:hypothetical protein
MSCTRKRFNFLHLIYSICRIGYFLQKAKSYFIPKCVQLPLADTIVIAEGVWKCLLPATTHSPLETHIWCTATPKYWTKWDSYLPPLYCFERLYHSKLTVKLHFISQRSQTFFPSQPHSVPETNEVRNKVKINGKIYSIPCKAGKEIREHKRTLFIGCPWESIPLVRQTGRVDTCWCSSAKSKAVTPVHNHGWDCEWKQQWHIPTFPLSKENIHCSINSTT